MPPTTPEYHRDATALLPTLPQFSGTAVEALNRRERELGIRFPDAVREWYSLEGAVDLLQYHSNTDNPLPIDRLGEPFPNWYGGGPKDFVPRGFLVFMCENQGVCNWAFRLDGNPDPAVFVDVDTAPNDEWLLCADKFSTFIYCQIWDHGRQGVGVAAQELELATSDLELLGTNFSPRPSTYGWPGNTNYRFETDDGRILIWDSEHKGVDWLVSATSPADLRVVLSRIWRCGSLAETLHAVTPEAVGVLRSLRDPETTP